MSRVISENARGRKKRNADDPREVTSLRRSARLSQRYKSRQFPLTTSVYSRQSLGQYADESISTHESSMVTTSVLDESGQRIPIDFDQDDEDVVQHDHSYSKGMPSSLAHSHSSRHSSHTTYNRYSTLEDPEVPINHLFGLDEDDEELDSLMHTRDFNMYTKEKILTPPKNRAQPSQRAGPSCFGQILHGIGRLFYFIGSIVYLLFASIVCCDNSTLYRGGGISSRYCQKGFQSVVYFILFFAFVFISSTAPHVKYTPPVYIPSPPVESPTTVTTTITSTQTFSSTLVPSPTPSIDLELYKLLEALKAEFYQYKETQTSSLEMLKKSLEEYIKENNVELSSKLESTVTEEVGKERDQREAKIKELHDALLTKMEAELSNKEKSLNERLAQVLSDSAKRAAESGKMNEPAVRFIAQGLVNDTVSQLRTSLEGMIQELNSTMLIMKSEEASNLKQAYAEWKTTLHTLQDKLSQQIADNKKQADDQGAKASGERAAQEEDIKKLREELSALSIKIEKLEERIIKLELKDWTPPIATPTTVVMPPGITNETVLHMINEALHMYSADQIARFDFALESAGGHVIDSSNTYDPSETKPQLFGITLPITLSRTYPGVVIQPAVLPGDCWCFKGTQGHVTIKLASSAIIDGVTVQHIPKQLSPVGSIKSAVKSFTVNGLQSPTDDGTPLGTYEYSTDLPPIQTFHIMNKKSFGYVKFQFNSNHGNPDYTCVYRVRVHGTLN